MGGRGGTHRLAQILGCRRWVCVCVPARRPNIPQPPGFCHTHLLEAVEVAINVHGGPCEDEHTRRHLALHVLQVGPQQRLEHRLHLHHNRLVLLDHLAQLAKVVLELLLLWQAVAGEARGGGGQPAVQQRIVTTCSTAKACWLSCICQQVSALARQRPRTRSSSIPCPTCASSCLAVSGTWMPISCRALASLNAD